MEDATLWGDVKVARGAEVFRDFLLVVFGAVQVRFKPDAQNCCKRQILVFVVLFLKNIC